MKDLFISKAGVNYAAGLTLATAKIDNIGSMTTGAIAVFNEDGTLIDGTNPVAAADITGDYIQLVMATPDSKVKWSIPVYRKSFEYIKKAYTAPVKAVKVLGSEAAAAAGTYSLNLPSSLSVGDLVGFIVIDSSKEHWDRSREKEYSFSAVAGDTLTGTGASNIVTKLVTLINADSNRVVDAVAHNDGAGNNDGIKLTAVTAGKDFDLANIDGVLKDSDRLAYNIVNDTYVAFTTTVVANNVGQGTPAQITELESKYSTRDGNTKTQRLTAHMWSRTSAVVSGATYTTYVVGFTPKQDSVLSRDSNYKQEITIACPSGETGVLGIITVLDEIFALTAN